MGLIASRGRGKREKVGERGGNTSGKFGKYYSISIYIVSSLKVNVATG